MLKETPQLRKHPVKTNIKKKIIKIGAVLED
jgi:hypothetical protein